MKQVVVNYLWAAYHGTMARYWAARRVLFLNHVATFWRFAPWFARVDVGLMFAAAAGIGWSLAAKDVYSLAIWAVIFYMKAPKISRLGAKLSRATESFAKKMED